MRALFAIALFLIVALRADLAWAARVDFAKYQAVTASSQSSDYDPELAVDGIVSNFHSFRTANKTDPQWLQVTFPRAVTIASAHLYLGLDNDAAQGGLPSFKFQYHNGTAWVDVPGSAVSGNTAAERSVIFSSAPTSDRFRLYTTENGSRVIRELALFPPNLISGVEQGYPIGTDVHLSLTYKRPAVGSTVSSGGFPKLAVDGYVDDSSRWLCSTAASGSTLEVDLLEAHDLGSAHVYSGTGSGSPLASFTLQYWTGAAWAAIPGATITNNTSTARVITFSSSVTTSRIRLVTTTASSGRVRELLVFPPRAGGYPLGQDVATSAPPVAEWDDFSDSSWRLKNGGPANRLALVDGEVVYTTNTAGSVALDWQLLLNHRDGSYRLRHTASGGCLALGKISTAAGEPVVVEAYTALPHQDWYLVYDNATQFRLINVYSGLALTPAASQWAAGTQMVVAAPSTLAVQLWEREFSAYYPKKGIAGAGYDQFSASWFYNWGRSSSLVVPSNVTFNPMQWGDFNWTHGSTSGPVDLLRNTLQSDPKPVHLLGFNEPDHTDQGYMTPDDAIAFWPRLEALEAPLLAPCPANTFGDWLPAWAAQADALGYRRDYTPYHWYAEPDVDKIIADLTKAYTTYGRPVWLTEFSAISWTGTGTWTDADNYNFLAEFMWRAQALPWLKRYALFQFTEGAAGGTDAVTAPRSNTRKSDGTLTPFGELYAGWDGVTNVLSEKKYHVHNRGAYTRLLNPGGTAAPDLVTPTNSGAGTQWYLSPGVTAGTYRIISTRDGRPLRCTDGVTVTLGPATQTATSGEWRLVAVQDGWYFIEHPATGKRLSVSASGNFAMGAITSTTDSFKWRFVVPAVAENGAPVLAAIAAKTGSEGVSLTFTASGTDADFPADTLTYSLVGAPSGASITADTGVFSWTPTEAQGPGTFNFTVRVSDGVLSSDRAVSVTVNEVNVAPVLAAIAAKTGNEEVLLNFTASASDADLPANSLTYSLIGAPSGASINAATGVFSWTPTEAQGPGTFSFTVRVSDGALSSDRTVSVTVKEVNVAPVLGAIPAKTGNEGVLLSFTASASDADLPANSLTYSLIGAPSGASINASTGAFSWKPAAAQAPGNFNFTVRVSDGTLNSDRPIAITLYGVAGNPGDDPDGNGLSNLVEYALGVSPPDPSATARLLKTSIVAGKLTVAYRRPAGGGTPGVTYALEKNTQLSGAWSTAVAGVDYTQTIVANGDGTETLTATFSAPLAPGAGYFVRLALSVP